MSRAALVLSNDTVRERAIHWCRIAPEKTRVEFKEPTRTLDQNARMWAMLTDIARQKTHGGMKLDTETWKVVFLHALGKEVRFIPALDGTSVIPLGLSSSKLSKSEMSDLIESIFAWGAENGVVWLDPAVDEIAAQHGVRAA